MPPYQEEKNWVMNVGPGIHNDETMIMVDSRSFAHVCPKDFAEQFPRIPAKEKFSALTADGRPIVNYGDRR
eukprot:15206751-Heterocapsa_arctica.AAC.1